MEFLCYTFYRFVLKMMTAKQTRKCLPLNKSYDILLIDWVFSSVGRASPLQGESRGFKSLNTHHPLVFLIVFVLLFLGPVSFSSPISIGELSPLEDLKNLPQDATLYLQGSCSLLSHSAQREIDKTFNEQFFKPWSHPLISKEVASWGIKAFNQNLGFGENKQRHSPAWMDALVQLAQLTTYPNIQRKAISVNNTSLRILPTHQPHFNHFSLAGEGYPFDNLQQSVLWANIPLFVSHLSKDQAWAFVETPIASGWVQTQDIAFVDESFITAWKTGKYVALIKDRTAIFDDEQVFRFKTHIGALFPLLHEEEHQYQILIAMANEQRQAHLRKAHLSKEVATLKPWKLSLSHLAILINEMLAQPYGWGGLYENRDCSSTMKDLFTPFGLWLPRNSANQAHSVGQFMDLEPFNPSDKESFIIQKGVPALTLLWLEGHIMLYLGTHRHQAIAFHNTWGLKTRDAHGQEGREIIGQAVITTLQPGKELPQLDLQKGNLLNNILGMTLLFPQGRKSCP